MMAQVHLALLALRVACWMVPTDHPALHSGSYTAQEGRLFRGA